MVIPVNLKELSQGRNEIFQVKHLYKVPYIASTFLKKHMVNHFIQIKTK